MSDHNVSIDGDGQDSEETDSDESVSEERKEPTEKWSVHPRAVPKGRCGERQVEAAEHEIGHREVHDEHRRCVPQLCWRNSRKEVIIIIFFLEFMCVGRVHSPNAFLIVFMFNEIQAK